MAQWHVTQAALVAMNFIVAILVSIPLYWHLEGAHHLFSNLGQWDIVTYSIPPYPAWNVGCILYIGWVALSCFISAINGCIWRNNAINWSPVWGDISMSFVHLLLVLVS
jgi:pheromone a factor receptor